MTAGHFLFIPAVLVIGIVIGWILGARAARDAYLVELRKRERARKASEEKGSGVFFHGQESEKDSRPLFL